VKAVVIDVDAVLGDTRALWRDWLADAARRVRIEVDALPADRGAAAEELDRVLGNWRVLLERFAEDRVPVYLRPNAEVSAALRRLQADGTTLGAFTDAPEPLARVALDHVGARRRLDLVETGAGALDRVVERLGPEAIVVRTRDDLLRLAYH
jgi:phosphoglycolate phosphatase-like HAD superfamily hydrolase